MTYKRKADCTPDEWDAYKARHHAQRLLKPGQTRGHNIWKASEVKRAVQMWKDGVETKHIAKALDRTFSGVQAYVNAHRDQFPARESRGRHAATERLRVTVSAFQNRQLDKLAAEQGVTKSRIVQLLLLTAIRDKKRQDWSDRHKLEKQAAHRFGHL